MSVRSVSCPNCHASSNVPANMASARCPGCGAVFTPAAPTSPANSTSQGFSEPDSNTVSDSDPSELSEYLPVIGGVVLVVLIVLLIVGLSVVRTIRHKQAVAKEAAIQAEMEAELARKKKEEGYKIVDLPESTRKQIYKDYRLLVGSSTEKKANVMKDSKAGRSLNNMLQGIVDREITHIALQHRITEDDVHQIVLEGDDKQWPGSQKPKEGRTNGELDQ